MKPNFFKKKYNVDFWIIRWKGLENNYYKSKKSLRPIGSTHQIHKSDNEIVITLLQWKTKFMKPIFLITECQIMR